MGINFYAHSNQNDPSQWQLLIDHLNNTAAMASEMAHDCNISEYAYITALLHDIGKYSTAFQKRIKGEKIRVDHSSAGAQEIIKLFNRKKNQQYIAKLLAACIAGHHGGLLDFGSPIDLDTDISLWARIKRAIEPYQHYQTEVDFSKFQLPNTLPIKPDSKYPGFSLAFFTRMVYSALVDADFQETETFMNAGRKPRGGYACIDKLCTEYNRFLTRFDNSKNPIHQQRTKSLKEVMEKAQETPGFFTLTIPTGGGKTNTSLAFALNHARLHSLKRIIYVIPYTSIIEQNAQVFKDCLGEQNVLEHHSNFDWDALNENADTSNQDDQTRNVKLKLKLATENWDIPIIVTTNVQFFESLYANRSSRCRKIHNMAKSVIIFDEAQMLPQEFLQPCLLAIKELVINYGASAIFCTATQPALQRFFKPEIQFRELVDNPELLYEFYRRVQINNLGSTTDNELVEKINRNDQALCIVNTRRHARAIYKNLFEDGRFHLSTLMYPNHRKQTIKTIRQRLANQQTCRVVSTQILEAGVDLDFPVGYRALSGLDSIIQAAGRVNREGKNQKANLFVFEPDSDSVKRTPGYIKQGAEVARNILRHYSLDPINIDAIRAFYNLLYDLKDSTAFDQYQILKHFEIRDEKEPTFEFSSANDKFKLIKDNTRTVIIPLDDEALRLIEMLKTAEYPKSLGRKLQMFAVNIFENEFAILEKKGLIDTYCDFYSVLNDLNYYDMETGLQIPEQTGGDIIWFDG